jgi:hypothetical protein
MGIIPGRAAADASPVLRPQTRQNLSSVAKLLPQAAQNELIALQSRRNLD